MVIEQLQDHQNTLQRVIDTLVPDIEAACQLMTDTIKSGNKVLLAGNGGSAGDAQHIAAELTGRFVKDRKALPGIALSTDTSAITSIANDYGYDVVYSRIVKGSGKAGDVLVCLSTSGNSVNIIKAIEQAREIGMISVGLTGEGGGKMKAICDHLINVPSNDTPRIQESHITVGHIICQLVEQGLFKK